MQSHDSCPRCRVPNEKLFVEGGCVSDEVTRS